MSVVYTHLRARSSIDEQVIFSDFFCRGKFKKEKEIPKEGNSKRKKKFQKKEIQKGKRKKKGKGKREEGRGKREDEHGIINIIRGI